jgi:signal transduction histidine kinase
MGFTRSGITVPPDGIGTCGPVMPQLIDSQVERLNGGALSGIHSLTAYLPNALAERRRAARPQSWSLAAAVAWLLVVLIPTTSDALDPTRLINQFFHTSWTIADGAPTDVKALAQSSDGYLWIGTGAGLYRFDGVHFEQFHADRDPDLDGNNISALLALPNGELWVGFYNGGLAIIADGLVRNVPASDMGNLTQLAQGTDGTIWATSNSGVWRFEKDRMKKLGAEWNPPHGLGLIRGLLVTPGGALLVTTDHSVSLLRQGSRKFEDLPQNLITGGDASSTVNLVRSMDGSYWFSNTVRRANLLGGYRDPATDIVAASHRTLPKPSSSSRTLIDQDGGFWGADRVSGLYRLGVLSLRTPLDANGGLDAQDFFTPKDGLSSDTPTTLLEDREGNLWVGTTLGLDRIRAANVVANSGLPLTSLWGYRAAVDGRHELFISGDNTLFRIRAGTPPEPTLSDLKRLQCLAGGVGDWIWMCNGDKLLRLHEGKVDSVGLPMGTIKSTADRLTTVFESDDGTLWASIYPKGIFVLKNTVWSHFVTPYAPASEAASVMQGDGHGGLWLQTILTDVVLHVEGGHVHSFGRPADDSRDLGDINVVSPGPDGTLFGSNNGLSRQQGEQLVTLRATQYPVLRRISGIAQAQRGEIWLNTAAGIVRIDARALNAAFSRPSAPLSYELFDYRDGVSAPAIQDIYQNTAAESQDHRLWFLTSHGVDVVDPARIHHNHVPPPVVITLIRADGHRQSPKGLDLPAGLSNLQFDYAALSLSIPERVRFRYKLDGYDQNWIDPGQRREAFYTNLAPGAYRFHIIASNDQGVWNTKGATFAFVIPPTFLQSDAFKALCGILFLLFLWLLYSLRMRQVTEQVRSRMQERMTERERIARELHDTLLQGFQALVLRFQNIVDQIPTTQPTHRLIEQELERADAVIVEGRNRVRDLRGTPDASNLEASFEDAARGTNANFKCNVSGSPRALHPVVCDEIGKIGVEAILNAVRHASAQNIEVRLAYRHSVFVLAILDDGVGIDPATLESKALPGHFGLIGMRERSEAIQGELAIRSTKNRGTTVELAVPAAMAYTRSDIRGGFFAFAWMTVFGGKNDYR